MSTFLTTDDYRIYIKDNPLNQMVEDNAVLLDDAESTAIQFVRDALHSTYDVDAIFATVDENRPRQVLRWVISIALYLAYQRIPDRIMPDRILKDYDDTIEWLEAIEDGKKNVELPRITNEDGEEKSKFRWGSIQARSH